VPFWRCSREKGRQRGAINLSNVRKRTVPRVIDEVFPDLAVEWISCTEFFLRGRETYGPWYPVITLSSPNRNRSYLPSETRSHIDVLQPEKRTCRYCGVICNLDLMQNSLQEANETRLPMRQNIGPRKPTCSKLLNAIRECTKEVGNCLRVCLPDSHILLANDAFIDVSRCRMFR
jgi:hypothetical protein